MIGHTYAQGEERKEEGKEKKFIEAQPEHYHTHITQHHVQDVSTLLKPPLRGGIDEG